MFAYVCVRFVHERNGLKLSDSEDVYICSLNLYLHCVYLRTKMCICVHSRILNSTEVQLSRHYCARPSRFLQTHHMMIHADNLHSHAARHPSPNCDSCISCVCKHICVRVSMRVCVCQRVHACGRVKEGMYAHVQMGTRMQIRRTKL